MGDVFTSTYLPIAVGAVVAAVGSILFIMKSRAFPEAEQGGKVSVASQRRLAVRMVLVLYAIIAGSCFIVALAIGEEALIVLTGLIVILAATGLVRFWLRSR